MTKHDIDVDWQNATFDRSRHEQLRRAQAMTVRQRLEAMDKLNQLSERVKSMSRQYPAASDDAVKTEVREPPHQPPSI